MGAHTPACLRAASDPVETVTPPHRAPKSGHSAGASRAKLARAASLYCIPQSGGWYGNSRPGLWWEVPCFLQDGHDRYCQSRLPIELSRRGDLRQGLRGGFEPLTPDSVCRLSSSPPVVRRKMLVRFNRSHLWTGNAPRPNVMASLISHRARVK